MQGFLSLKELAHHYNLGVKTMKKKIKKILPKRKRGFYSPPEIAKIIREIEKEIK